MADTKKGSINELGLTHEKLQDTNFEDIPENLGQTFADPPQPGKYRFRMPAHMNGIWQVVETTEHGKRVNAVFDNDAPLVIVQSPGQAVDGEEFTYRISNVPRPRTKEKILVSDMQLLLRAFGETKTPQDNIEYAKALQKYEGKEFGATLEFSWRCNPDRDAYFDDGQGGTAKVEARVGCGARYYQRDVPKVEGNWPVRITCSNPECGASVRAFPNLTGFTK